MTQQRADDGRTLRLLRRAVQPYALAVSLATAVVVASMLTESGVGAVLDGLWGKAIGVVAAVATVELWVGWWAQSRRWMLQGLLTSAAVWSAIGTIILIEQSSWVSGALALCWAVASSGAWLLEVNDKEPV